MTCARGLQRPKDAASNHASIEGPRHVQAFSPSLRNWGYGRGMVEDGAALALGIANPTTERSHR
jgi:hypothetical protein